MRLVHGVAYKYIPISILFLVLFQISPALSVGLNNKFSLGLVRFEYMISPELETCGTVGFQILDKSFGSSGCRIGESHIFSGYKENVYSIAVSEKAGFWAATRFGAGYIWSKDRNGVCGVAGGAGGLMYKRLSLIFSYFTFSYTKSEIYYVKQQVFFGLGYDFWI